MSWQMYEILKAEWKAKNPNATSKEYEAAMMAITRKLGI